MRALAHWLMAAGLALGSLAQAAPQDVPMDTRLLQRTDLAYRFETFTLDSADGQRHYQVWVGLPRRPAPAQGYPVLYMLDGNAALEALDPPLLAQLDQGQAPVLVAVGYAGQRRIDRSARTYDYTPQRVTGEQRDPMTGEPSGGAQLFLKLLVGPVATKVEALAPIDPQRTALWGHSYGGLFTLGVLLDQPSAFTTYIAASPSLWWAPGWATRHSQGLPARLAAPRRLWLMQGEAEPARPRPNLPPAQETAAALAQALAPVPGLSVRYQGFPGLGHGPMLAASLRQALQWLNEEGEM
ncbi:MULTISPECIES: alpha/beta hydrolase [unclassified Pseudomonas]|uniref:alpha/beta hydrolase n=1 Tax=unclassified Pseudomonas TaxID=196821 RepID=UPI000BD6CEAB|nr:MULTISPECIES: alpha/beta hydrolase-fold protein [unclassified Pseudomonas]PVZ11366.1 hypothetical protein F474_03692 [Pseudomonas sp. URIL14HWK12:I12]PVZ22364.1 hypothetical protein F470_03692 [Pseudomonas sp. URIL14HWK12:I10]PVZ31512.1 hypothetical protein F472_03679 [Pseudomonas sp. URIL14HWK12:I11]SNZ16472.1 hypothetical protein SAMN05660463_03318 [Pseudomonas sp. URIL14HWK12:I9]